VFVNLFFSYRNGEREREERERKKEKKE